MTSSDISLNAIKGYPMDDLKNYQEQLPLREATLFILLSLAPNPKHGYAILKEVESLSNGRVVFSTGTLYGALKRLLKLQWIERINDIEIKSNQRKRKTYQLTELGHKILKAEISRLNHLMEIAQTKHIGDFS